MRLDRPLTLEECRCRSVRREPLAIADGRSIGSAELVPSARVYLDRVGEVYHDRLLAPLDHQGLLSGTEISQPLRRTRLVPGELLAELQGVAGRSDLTELRHVRKSTDKRAAGWAAELPRHALMLIRMLNIVTPANFYA